MAQEEGRGDRKKRVEGERSACGRMDTDLARMLLPHLGVLASLS